MRKFVIYRRVSTEGQGKSGLGLDAQDRDIQIYLDTYADTPFQVLGTFTDVISGSSTDRPELSEAITMAKREGATLLVAKLDRLSRKVSHIAALMDDKKLAITVACMPYADRFQLHVYAALAEQEREFISKRTKAALAAAKARGVKLGGIRPGTRRHNKEAAERADTFAAKLLPIVKPMRERGDTFAQIANHLNASGTKTARGGAWYATSVKNILERSA